MDEKTRQRGSFIINVLFFMTIACLLYLIFKYALSWFAPFILGFILASFVDPLIKIITRRLRINRTALSVVLMLIVWALLCLVVLKLGEEVYIQAKNLLKSVQTIDYAGYTQSITSALSSFTSNMPPEFANSINDLVSNAVATIFTWATGFLGSLTSLLLSIPNIIIFLVVSLVSSVFISIDMPVIKSFFEKQVPDKYRVDALETRVFFSTKVLNIIRAYAIIITITFIELFIGFLIIGVEYAFLMAMLVAILDLLPIVGTSTFLVPWGIVTMIGGNIGTGVGLIIIAIVVSVVREVIQPKIVGSQIGLSPLLTLVSMYVGLKIFGVVGLFLFPLILIFLMSLNESGRLKLWKK